MPCCKTVRGLTRRLALCQNSRVKSLDEKDLRGDAFYGKAKSCIRQWVGLDSRIQPPTGADLLIY
jgi:hypothetical protein